jgi:hypothetical protein
VITSFRECLPENTEIRHPNDVGQNPFPAGFPFLSPLQYLKSQSCFHPMTKESHANSPGLAVYKYTAL